MRFDFKFDFMCLLVVDARKMLSCAAVRTRGFLLVYNFHADTYSLHRFLSRRRKVTNDFLEKYVLVNGVRDLFQKVGKYSKW